jgi:nitrate/nitrite-specific signal transduction histidine kinase
MGVIDTPHLDMDCEAVSRLMDMYQSHGHAIALQYAGSHLVNTVESYRSSSSWHKSKNAVNNLKRYYSNSFTDAEKQNAMNLFLGRYVPEDGKLNLWELGSDWCLHNPPPNHPTVPRKFVSSLCYFFFLSRFIC